MRFRRTAFAPLCGLLLTLVACRPSPSPTRAPAPAAPEAAGSSSAPPLSSEAPTRKAFSGDVPPREFPETFLAKLAARGVVGDREVRSYSVDRKVSDVLGAEMRSALEQGISGSQLSLDVVLRDASGRVVPTAFVVPGPDVAGSMTLWVATRRGEATASEGAILAASGLGTSVRFRVRLGDGTERASELGREYRMALADWFEGMPETPLSGFARQRLSGRTATPGERPTRWASQPMREAMSLFSGHRSVELAISAETDAPFARSRETTSLASLVPPPLPTHDYAAMVRKIGGSVEVPSIFAAVPAEFYAIHARTGGALFEALREGESVAAPAFRLLEDAKESSEVRERYLRALGLVPTELSERFGPKVIDEVVLVGSDPFLARGSDVTLLFRAKDANLFSLGIAASLMAAAEGHGEVRREDVSIGGRTFRLASTSDGVVRRFEGRLGELFVVGSSRAALERLVRVSDGKGPRLSDEDDFRYLMTRDGKEPADVVAFAGDRFFRELASPRARVVDARRRLAWVELRRIGFAQLLGGLLGLGERPSLDLLVREGLLRREELVHFDGSPISLDRSGVAISRWGTARTLVPILEAPAPTRVTEEEVRAYEAFSIEYARVWGVAVDPLMLRVAFDEDRIRGKLRVFPLAADRELFEVLDFVGESRFDGKTAAPGLRIAAAIAANSSLRRSAESIGPSLVGEQFSLGWLGDVGFLGVLDEPSLERAVFDEVAPLPPDGERRDRGFDGLFEAPIYFGLAVKSPRQALLFLDLARSSLASGHSLRFSVVGKVGTHEIVEVAFADGDLHVRGYYALGERTLYGAFDARVVAKLLEREARGEEPLGGSELPLSSASQIELSLRQESPSSLRRVLGWLHELENPRPTAELGWYRVLRAATGASEPAATASFALARFGTVPLSRDGRPLEFDERGVVEPGRGSVFHPTVPEFPAPGSDLARLLDAFSGIVLSVAFEPEAGSGEARDTSLRVRFDLERARSGER